MKILLAIESEHPNEVDKALRWTGQLGYEMRVFCPRNKRKKYIEAINDANYNWYLALTEDQIVTKYSPEMYALLNGFELVVYIPEDLMAWRKGSQFKDKELSYAFPAIGNARGEFSRQPKKRIKRWPNGCRMERVG